MATKRTLGEADAEDDAVQNLFGRYWNCIHGIRNDAPCDMCLVEHERKRALRETKLREQNNG